MSWASLVVHRRMEPKFNWIEFEVIRDLLNLEYFFCDWKFSIKIKIQMKISDFKFRWKVYQFPAFQNSFNITICDQEHLCWVDGWLETVFHNNGSSVTVGVCLTRGRYQLQVQVQWIKIRCRTQKVSKSLSPKKSRQKSVEGTWEIS